MVVHVNKGINKSLKMDINMMHATRAHGHYSASEITAAKREQQRIDGALAHLCVGRQQALCAF